jgi:hypothetical protein
MADCDREVADHTGNPGSGSNSGSTTVGLESRTALGLRRVSPAERCNGPPAKVSLAPCVAACRAHDPGSSSNARVTGAEVMTGAHFE